MNFRCKNKSFEEKSFFCDMKIIKKFLFSKHPFKVTSLKFYIFTRAITLNSFYKELRNNVAPPVSAQ